MSTTKSLCSALVATVAFAGSAQAATIPVANNVSPDLASLGVGSTFVPLDLTGASFLTGSVNQGVNGYTQNFAGVGSNFSGNLTVEVFGNVSTIGTAALTDVLLVYTFTGDTALTGAESFEFGVDTSLEVDVSALQSATHGRVTAGTSLEAGQTDPFVSLNDFGSAINDTWFFDHTQGGTLGGSTGMLGGSASETYQWYVQTSGDVKLNFTDVLVTDGGSTKIRSLSLVVNPGQSNLNVPAPSAAIALATGLGAAATRRRRRS